MSSKRKTRGSTSPLLNGTGDLVKKKKNTIKAEVLNGFFISAFTGKADL